MTFPAPYQKLPEKVNLKIKSTGKNVELSLEAEEMASWWAEVEVQDLGQQEKVK